MRLGLDCKLALAEFVDRDDQADRWGAQNRSDQGRDAGFAEPAVTIPALDHDLGDRGNATRTAAAVGKRKANVVVLSSHLRAYRIGPGSVSLEPLDVTVRPLTSARVPSSGRCSLRSTRLIDQYTDASMFSLSPKRCALGSR